MNEWIGKRLEVNERKVCEKLIEARMTVEEGESVSEIFNVFKDAVTTIAAEAVVYRALKNQRKGSAVKM